MTFSGLGDTQAVLHLLSHLYVQRSLSLWKDPTLSSWLADTVTSLLPSIPSPTDLHSRFLKFYETNKQKFCIWRHAMIMESNYRTLLSFIPKMIMDAKSFACDPLPPMTLVSMYDEEFFRGTEDVFAVRGGRSRRQRDNDGRMLERLIPDPVFRGQLQVYRMHPFESLLIFNCGGCVRQFSMPIRYLRSGFLEGLYSLRSLRDSFLKMCWRIC
jgi:hypothetical protein